MAFKPFPKVGFWQDSGIQARRKFLQGKGRSSLLGWGSVYPFLRFEIPAGKAPRVPGLRPGGSESLSPHSGGPLNSPRQILFRVQKLRSDPRKQRTPLEEVPGHFADVHFSLFPDERIRGREIHPRHQSPPKIFGRAGFPPGRNGSVGPLDIPPYAGKYQPLGFQKCGQRKNNMGMMVCRIRIMSKVDDQIHLAEGINDLPPLRDKRSGDSYPR